ncbi:bifunctional diguanylate cyclase/phosphodiesterase [Erythrobacter sp. SD-21]|uniref:putative bifunctional diguanylate cyclase/phosphodiesterase n=1 Tax=Erythrobacter sp. SD-21 TaxID=161528 RepID=UPI000153FC2B|nr:EAL domain-containing protein [Erythrobacter sp. SD-21]EDL49160.1 sensory box/GGDEF family protein [Erythrobacter sp. SD-21]
MSELRPDDPLARFLLYRRLKNFSSGATTSLLPAFASIFGLLWTFWNGVPQIAIAIWAAIQAAQLCFFVWLDRQIDFDDATVPEMETQWRRILILQAIGSTIWFVVFPYLAPYAEGLEIAVLGIIGTAILCGTLLVHRNAPQAALFHTLTMAPSLAVAAVMIGGWGAWPSLILIASFAVALIGETRTQERYFVGAARAEIERRENNATVRMLLNDYEEQSSDWLWTVGPRGNMRDVTERLGAALSTDPDHLEGMPFLDLFVAGEERDALATRLLERSPFRDLIVRLRVKGDVRYWRISARPRDDGRMSGVARDVTAGRLIEERVAFMAHYDNLTGLANRYLFNERLRSLAGEQASRGSNIALFYLDLDDFKAINDTRGHLVGDRMLREVGTRLEQEVRSEDLVARLGGDEFAVLIETRAGDGLLIERAHRFLSVVRAPYEIEGHSYRVSTSVGVARCTDGDCDAEELMRRADLALYAAKEKGRDNLALFEPALDRIARERRETEIDLREALTRGQMRMHYQAIVDLDTGETTGLEALLRWYHPQRGIIPPGDFLTIAEETGMITSLGEWVIRQTLSDAAALPGNFRIAINLSPTQVKNPNLVATVAQAIHATNIAPERVELEITEHVLMDQGAAGHVTLLRLRELGIRIALDDFGTGYSSLGYLRRFPFDRIKIDRTFVTDVASDLGSQAIVSTITRLADALGMDTTAEGIEDQRQLDLLRKLGVQEAQGFLIGRPVPPEEIVIRERPAAGNEAQVETETGEEFLEYRNKRQAIARRRGGSAVE